MEIFEKNFGPELSQAGKEARFHELFKNKENLVTAFQEALDKGAPQSEDEFMAMEDAIAEAADSALAAGKKEEYERLKVEYMDWRHWRLKE